jgi:sugar lactone lactonase YvrE
MNDLVAMDNDKFYITKFYGSSARDGVRHRREIAEKIPLGQIMYYDGSKATVASPELFHLPNGINVSPDKR